MEEPGCSYVGGELEIFAEARRWKEYLGRQLKPFLGADVLEVGAGIGSTTRMICSADTRRWVCLEPDARMAERLGEGPGQGVLPSCCTVIRGTTEDLLNRTDRPFDSVLYIDVIEHIEDDRGELDRAVRLLREGGHLVVVSPAHAWLFSPLDVAVGHYRRYSLTSLQCAAPQAVDPVRLRYLDSAGLLASAANRFLMRQTLPTAKQIRFWDSVLVRISTWLDPCLGYRAGKSVLGVWRRVGAAE